MRIHFKTKEAAALWKYEILGQISDGMWENAKPKNHWKFWHNCDVVIDGKLGFDGGYPSKTDYNLISLIPHIADRMIGIINAEKNNKNQELADYLADPDFYKIIQNPESKGKYWINAQQEIKKEYGEDLEKDREYVLKPYNKNDLKKFLYEIMESLNTNLSKNENRQMKTFKQFLKEEMNKKDQKYFLDQANKLKNGFDKWYKEAETFCKELYDEGELENEASTLMDEIDDIENNVLSKIRNIVTTIKRS